MQETQAVEAALKAADDDQTDDEDEAVVCSVSKRQELLNLIVIQIFLN